MVRAIVVLLVFALISALLGFGGLAGEASGMAVTLFYVFLVILVISFLFKLLNRA